MPPVKAACSWTSMSRWVADIRTSVSSRVKAARTIFSNRRRSPWTASVRTAMSAAHAFGKP